VSVHSDTSSVSFVLTGPTSTEEQSSSMAVESFEALVASGAFSPLFGEQPLGIVEVCGVFGAMASSCDLS
jgi:hypothetical protein